MSGRRWEVARMPEAVQYPILSGWETISYGNEVQVLTVSGVVPPLADGDASGSVNGVTLTPEQLACDHVCSSNLAVDSCGKCGASSLQLLAAGQKMRNEGGSRTRAARVADLEALVERANEVARQAWEIADQRGKRIMELETEVAALTDTLRTLFKSAAQPPTPPADAVEFPVNALRWGV